MGRPSPAAIACAVAALALGACGPPARTSLVVWIEVDTLRAEALGCYGNSEVGEGGAGTSPSIDALALDAVRFERAYAPAPWTIPSVVSQMTGLWPSEHRALRIAAPVPLALETVAERLAGAGWRTRGLTASFVTAPRITPGFEQGFERFDGELARGHEGSTAREAVERVGAQLDELAPDPRSGVFLFAFLFEPHFRYEAHDGLRFGPGFGSRVGAPYSGALTGLEPLADLRARRGELAVEDAEFLRGRYHSEVAVADAEIGKLLASLRDRGAYDDALVVVTADHGEELLERGWLGHTVSLHEELVRVPLMLKLPGNAHAGAVIGAPVSLVDLPATLLDYAGAGGKFGRSRSLRALVEGGAAPRRYLLLHSDFEPPLPGEAAAESRTLLFGVVDGARRLKYVEDRLAGTARLFDLAADPAEAFDLAGSGRPEEAELSAVLRALERGEDVE